MNSTASPEAMMGMFALIFALSMILMVTTVIGQWKCFTKASKPGWACLVPFYNLVVTLQIIKKPMWWIALCFIPLVNLAVFYVILFRFCKSFGKGFGAFLLMVLFQPIGWLYLGFGDAEYQG